MEEIILNRLSIFIEQIKTLSEGALADYSNLTKENLEAVKIVCSKLHSLLNCFQRELYNYFKISTDPDADKISEFTSIQVTGEETVAELDAKLKIFESNSTAIAKTNGDSHGLSSKLPKLNLPEFSGDVLEWHQFWDQFSSNIDKRNLPDVDKLLYLKASLNGQAKKTIEGLDTTNKNYQIAVSTLKERYGKESQIIDAHYSALYKIKPANRMADCRKTLNEIERHIRVLNSLGENTNHNHLRFLIVEKFPENIIYEMKLKLKTESIEDMRKILEIIISAREDANKITQENHPNENYTVETLHVNNRLSYIKNSNRNSMRNDYKHNIGNNNINNIKTNYRNNVGNNNTNNARNSFKFNKSISKVGGKRKYEELEEESMKRKGLSCIFCGAAHYNDECKKVKTVNERKLKLKRRCYNCFRQGHRSNICQYKRKCVHCGQFGNHNRALCTKAETTQNLHIHNQGSTVLQTAVVNVFGQNTESVKCRLLLDSGSQRSYVTQTIAKKLNLEIEENNRLSVFTFGAKYPQELDSPLVRLNVKTRINKTLTIFANIVPTISQGVAYPANELREIKLKDNYTLADDGSLSDNIDILVGNDYYYSLMSMRKIKIRENLYLVESEFGWILSGCSKNEQKFQSLSFITYFQSSCEIKLTEPDPPIDDGNVRSLWDLESIGITDSPKINREEEAIRQFNENTIFKDNRYVVCWPWNEYPPHLPSNFGLAFGRLVNLLKRMDSETLSAYNQILEEQLKSGIIEIVQANGKLSHPVHYLPHHGVSTPGKPIRIVYDASAKTKDNKSLNQCLYCGPTMLEDLTGLLLKFRCHPIGLIADVEKAFLQIALHEKDRDVTRFLWLKEFNKPATEDNLLILRFTRVPFGIISSPFLLNATIKHHLLKSKKEINRRITHDIYVDNLVTGAKTTQEALELYKNSKEVFQEISMNLRNWSSNSRDFVRQIPDSCEDRIIKVLGLNWYLENDTLSLRPKSINNAKTKRGILKNIASIYDPCGYTVPSLLPAKLLLQDLWKMKIKWDTTLPQDWIDRWNLIINELKDIENIRIPRCYAKDINNINMNCQLHCFTDASAKAYACVVYIVIGGNKSFVIGKSRLVPIKDQADLKIPRLELLGVLIGSRLIQYTLKFLPLNITQQILWTDSQIVIDWYNSNKLLTPFVSRRIEEIKGNKDLVIKYVPSELNPADVATRPTSSKEEKLKWLIGPEFITKNPNEWPTNSSRELSLFSGEVLPNYEMKERQRFDVMNEPNNSKENIQDDVIDQNTRFDRKNNKEQDRNKCLQDNTLQELKELQSEYFPEEVNGIETNLGRNLGLFKDIDGILRCKGRLQNAEWSFDKRYPVIIPKDCEFTKRIIMDTHEKNYHVGSNHTLSLIRQFFWIPHGKSQVQKVLRKCPRCVKHGGGPFKLPPAPALPPERVNFSKPFTFTGMDYLGPVLIKNGEGTNKRWICLFTCLAVRAIHLEVVQNLTAEEGLLALRRMIATKGLPTLITSDNALYFKLIAEIVSKPYCVDNKIRWRFIPELAPWFGGFYERLVHLVKHCMRRTLQKHLLRDSQLATVIKEVEAVLNTRPLTCVDSELEHILKPSDFLNLGNSITMETKENPLIEGTITKMDLVKSWKKSRIILEEFKEMFRNRYLPSLRERYWHSHKDPRNSVKEIPKVGQIVQIKSDRNREDWKVGKIVSLVKGADGLYRVANVKVGNTTYTRSISHLYPLEVEGECTTPSNCFNRKLEDKVDSQTRGETIYEPEAVSEGTIDLQVERPQVTPVDMDIGVVISESPEITDSNKETTNDQSIITEGSKDSMDITNGDLEEPNTVGEQAKERRGAAVRALERIRAWTRDLSTTLL